MTDDLKPCPFCRGREVRVQQNGLPRNRFWECVCDDCDFCGPAFDTKGQAVDHWDTRTPAVAETPSGWRSMDSAPKEDCLVDLWCENPFEDAEPSIGIRLTDCYWTDRGWARTLDDGHEDYVEEDAACVHGLPAWRPIAWMPIPPPPDTQDAALRAIEGER